MVSFTMECYLLAIFHYFVNMNLQNLLLSNYLPSTAAFTHCLIIKFKVNFPENGFLSPHKLSLLEKLLPERKEVEETDEMDQVGLLHFDPNQERWHHYKEEAYEDVEHHRRAGGQCQTSEWGQ